MNGLLTGNAEAKCQVPVLPQRAATLFALPMRDNRRQYRASDGTYACRRTEPRVARRNATAPTHSAATGAGRLPEIRVLGGIIDVPVYLSLPCHRAAASCMHMH
jgi:hypothetical protein